MKKLLPLLLSLVCSVAYSQGYTALVRQADTLYARKNYKQSVGLYKQAFKINQKSRIDLHKAAQSAALAGEDKLAFKWLLLAFKNYNLNMPSNLRRLKANQDFIALHGGKKWKKLVTPMQKEVDQIEVNYDKPLQAALLQIGEDDQKYRGQLRETAEKYSRDSREKQDLWKIINETDSINLIKVTTILDKYGWAGVDKVGEEANKTLFFVIQHSNLATQQKYLPMMREAVKNKQTNGHLLALSEDRVALGEGGRQTYGSQIGRDNETGKSYVLPLDDPDNVDKRRLEVGLGPLAEYVKLWNIEWNVEAYKKQLPALEAKQRMKN